jgi:MFS family permease
VFGDSVDRAFSLVEALPLEAHAVMGVVLIAAATLWLFGGRVVRPLFAVFGMALGAMIGLFVVPALGLVEVAGQPATWIGAGVGGVIGLVLALVLLKVAIVFSAGLAFAAAGLLGATVYLERNPLPGDGLLDDPALVEDGRARDPSGRLLFTNPYTGEEMTIDELTRTLRETERLLGGPGSSGVEADAAGADGPEASRERLEAIAVRCRAVAAEAFEAVKTRVNGMNARERVVIAGATFGGLALGMLVGFVFPKRSTAVVTALAGSAVMLIAGVWLIDALAPSWNHLTDRSPEIWGVIWGIVFLLGLVGQLAGLGKSGGAGAPKKTSDDDEDDGDEDEE